MYGAEMLRIQRENNMPEKRRRQRLTIREAARRIGRQLPWSGAFFLLSIAQCLSVPSPFAVCCLMALLNAGADARGAVFGVLLSAVFRLVWGLPPDFGLMAACAACFAAIRLPHDRRLPIYLLTAALLLIRSVPDIALAQETLTVLLSMVGMLLGLSVMPALLKSAGLLTRRKKEWSEDDLLCLSLPLILLVLGAGRLTAFQMNLGYLLSCAGVLLLGWTAGSAFAVFGALGCGLALLLGGQSALMMVTLAFGGLVTGLFQGKNRLLPAGVFLLSTVVLIYLIANVFLPAVFYAALMGTAAFVLLPAPLSRRVAKWVRAVRWSQPRENAYTRLKMQRWVRSIDQLADALPHPRVAYTPRQEEEEELRETLCQGCERMPICWHDAQEKTEAAFAALAGRGDDPEEYLPLINRYFTSCPRIARIPTLLSRLDAERRERKHRAVCAEYERDMLQTHLTALSQAAQRISLEGLQSDSEESYWTAQADEALAALRFPGETAFVKKIDGRMAVCLKCEPLSLRPLAGMTLARQVSTYLNAEMEVTERSGSRILLEEKAPLRVATGMATACAVSLEKKRSPGQRPDNGDAVLIEPLSGGKMVLALSDGMGHGAGAQDESRKTLEMLSLCLGAGYTRAQAMTAVNGAMLSATGGEKFATVDLCLIDLWTGETTMNKLGACASLLVQGQKTLWIEGEALPLGIIEHVAPMEHRFTLAEGDLLLMMSDGVTDAFSEQEEIERALRSHLNETPQQIADALLRCAMLQKDGLPPDDMTVLCARMTDRKSE